MQTKARKKMELSRIRRTPSLFETGIPNLLKFIAIFLLTAFIPLSAFAGTFQYTYDDLNRLTRVDFEDSSTLEYTYDSAGNMTHYTATPPSADHFKVTGSDTLQAGGTLEITVSACDVSGNVINGYVGDKTLVFSGATSSPNPHDPTCVNKDGTDVIFGNDTVLAFGNGVATTTLKLYNVETANIKATEGAVTTSDEDDLDITVSPGAKNKLLWATQPPASVKAG